MTGHNHQHGHGHGHNHQHDHQHAPGGQDWGELADHLELEAEVLSPYLHEAMSLLLALASATPQPVRRVVDMGCGPGVATTALASAFPEASVVALDREPALLHLVRGRADRQGMGDRVKTVVADLEAALTTLETLGPVDLAWAGMVLHHLANPTVLLGQVLSMLRPGGLLAIAEFGPATRTLPDDLGFGEKGFAGRHAAAVDAAIEAHLPAGAMHLDWPGMLRAAGFIVVEHRTLMVDLPAPLAGPARRLVSQGLVRSAAMVQERLSVDDLATLAVLTNPTDSRSMFQRADLEFHAGRTLYVARRPL